MTTAAEGTKTDLQARPANDVKLSRQQRFVRCVHNVDSHYLEDIYFGGERQQWSARKLKFCDQMIAATGHFCFLLTLIN